MSDKATKRHRWNHKSNARDGINGSIIACVNCECIKEWIGGRPTYFINDTIYHKAPNCSRVKKVSKMKIAEIIGKKIAVHLETPDEALRLVTLLLDLGLAPTEINSQFWLDCKQETCAVLINFSETVGVISGSIDYYRSNGYDIVALKSLDFSDFTHAESASAEPMEPGKAYMIDYGGTQIIGRYINSDTTQHFFHAYLHYWSGHETFKKSGYCVKAGIQSIRRASPAEIHTLIRFEIDNGTI